MSDSAKDGPETGAPPDDPIIVGRSTNVSEADLRNSFSAGAVLSNRVFLTKMAGGIRLSFMEQNGDKVSPQLRAAVFLQFQDALGLRNLLIRQLKDVEEWLTEAVDDAMKEAAKEATKDAD